MPEEVVEQVGLDQIVDFLALANPHRHRKAAMREMIVEGGVGDQPRDADEPPASERVQPSVDRGKIRNRVADAERFQPFHELPAGVAAGERALAFDQQPPHRLLLVGIGLGALLHRPVRCHAGIVATELFERGYVHALNMRVGRW